MATRARNWYTLLYDLKRYRNLDPTLPGDAKKDTEYRTAIFAASRMWEGSTLQWFYPRYQTRYFDFPIDDTVLKVDEPLLSVSTFLTNNGALELSSDEYYLMCGTSYNLQPYNKISLKTDGSQPNMLFSGTSQRSQSVAGFWGYHEEYDLAWQDSEDSVQNDPSISAAETALTVANANGADYYGFTPRFKEGQLLRVVTSSVAEFMEVVKVDTAGNILTVIRGVNGTTAAVHLKDTTIEVYKPMGDIEQAVRRLAAWVYEQRNAPFTNEIQTFAGGATIKIPPNAPADVIASAKIYKRFDL